jgi:uncharacterized membrane protein
VIIYRNNIVSKNFLISGAPSFRAFSPIMAYSICLHILLNVTTYISVRYRLLAYYNKENSFENFVYVYFQILVALNFVFVPALMWFDLPKAIRYFDNWVKFQVR